jgi:gamma-glutamyltranspeptidase/glutathione hydrolase
VAGDRITGAPFATRSTAWGTQAAAATAHPIATQVAMDVLRAGGSAVDAAVAANAALGLLEPTGCGIGGDVFALLWDPRQRKVVGINGSGRSPRGLSLETVRSRAVKGHIPSHGAVSVSVPGAVDGWWAMHQRYGKMAWGSLFEPAIQLAERGVPVPQTVAYYLERNMAGFERPDRPIEDRVNARRVYAPNGRTAREGEVFRNPDLANTYRLIARGGRDAFYDGPIAEAIERYFRRIGGWMTRADLSSHRAEWVEPLVTNYRGVDVYGLPPNSQGLSTLQLLNIAERFDLKGMGFQSAASIHHQAEAKRLAFEDRARLFADPAFFQAPVGAAEQQGVCGGAGAASAGGSRHADGAGGRADAGGHDLLHRGGQGRDDGVDHQSNYRGMGSGLVSDGWTVARSGSCSRIGGSCSR